MVRKFAKPRFQQRTLTRCLGTIVLAIAVLLAAWNFLGGWVFIPFILFLIILGLGLHHRSRRIAPRLRDGREPLDRYDVVPDALRIVVVNGNESDDHFAALRFIEGVAWPALIVTESGIPYQKYEPPGAILSLPAVEEAGPRRPLPDYLASEIHLLLGSLLLIGAWSAYTYLKDSGIVR